MNLKGKLTSAQTLKGTQSIAGGGSTPTGDVTWSQVKNKPFNRVDTTGGLAIYDNTLMIDTLDHIATIDYVDEQIADIDLSDYATKSELDAVEAEIPSLTGYATEQYVDTAISNIPDPTWNDIQNKPTFATVATSGDYDDLSNKPTIPSIDGLATETYVNDAIAAIDIPEDVSELNNDAGYITSSALNGYATETYVDTAISNIPDPDWSDVQNKPTFATVATSGSYNDLSNTPTIPQPTSVTVTKTLSTGTAIADIDVDGVTTTLYAPAGGSGSQADWAETDSTADSYIQNKPAIYAGTDNSVRIGINNASYNISAATNSLAIGRQPNTSRGGIQAVEESMVIGRKYDNYDGKLSASHSALAIGEVDAASSALNDYVWAQYGSIALKGKRSGTAYGHATTISAQNGSFAAGIETYRGTISAKDGSMAFGQAGIPSTSSQRTEITANKTSFAGGKSTYNSSRHGVYAGYNPETGTTNGIAFAFGENVRAYQIGSVAMGQSVEAQSPSQMAVGSFNIIDNASTYNFIVGNGTAHTSRSNSFAAGSDGNVYVKGNIYTNVSDFTNPTTNGTKLANIPTPPTTDGTYTLQVVVSNGEPTYSWI